MASARVEHMLEEIAQLSHEEQAELVRDLPRVLRQEQGEGSRGRLSVIGVQRAIEIRGQIRQRLVASRQTPGSINQDLDAVRDDRLDELLDLGAAQAARDQAQ